MAELVLLTREQHLAVFELQCYMCATTEKTNYIQSFPLEEFKTSVMTNYLKVKSRDSWGACPQRAYIQILVPPECTNFHISTYYSTISFETQFLLQFSLKVHTKGYSIQDEFNVWDHFFELNVAIP